MTLILPKPNEIAENNPFTRADKKAQKKLGEMPPRPKHWVSGYFWRAFDLVAETEKYQELCKQQEVSPHTVRAYLVAALKDSNSQGKDVWTGLRKLAKRINREYRTAQRARWVARKIGFELGARRCWVNPAHGGIVSASARMRFTIPEGLENQIREQKIQAATKTRLARPYKPKVSPPKQDRQLIESERPKIQEWKPEQHTPPDDRERSRVKETLRKLRPG